MARFDGKVAVLTGAASGIGRATALQLVSEGARVLGLDLDEAGLEETAKRAAAPAQGAGGAFAHRRFDVRSREACFEVVGEAVDRFGRLDVLGNIAGVNRFSHFHEMSREDWDLLIGVNLSGVAFMCQAAIPQLLETGGSIVNLASTAGLIGQAYGAAYCASKGGVVQLTRALAMEYVRQGIRVNAVAPGGVDTEMNQDVRFPEGANPKLIQRYMSFRGLCRPEEIASVVAFLASDDARYVHGAIWSVDGATTAG